MKSFTVSRRRLLRWGALATAGLLTVRSQVQAQQRGDLTPLVYGTNWFAQAEHGGFYQAVAKGFYEKLGLDVSIRMGGGRTLGAQLLVGGAVDLYMGSGSGTLRSAQQGLPLITVAAIFQKDPQVLLAHPNTGVEELADIVGRPTYVSTAAFNTYWPFLRARYGVTDEQTRPYNFNPGPFLSDPQSIQQGILTSEPFVIAQEAGFEPVVLLLADYGYNPYSTTILTTRSLVQQSPEVVERFVEASIAGWYDYFEDPEPAFGLIKADNPEMSDELLAYGFEKIQTFELATSGDAADLGIGAMTHERWQEFYDLMVEIEILEPFDYRQAYTLDFVNKGVEYYRSLQQQLLT
ncbi:MAG: ABC transporter substrate-binding protein [Thermostichus sp. HHBFW_bins_43]